MPNLEGELFHLMTIPCRLLDFFLGSSSRLVYALNLLTFPHWSCCLSTPAPVDTPLTQWFGLKS